MDAPLSNDAIAGPPKPETMPETDVPKGALEDLALKVVYLLGPLSLLDLSRHLRLGIAIADDLLLRMRSQHFCEVVGMTRNIPEIAISTQGRSRALELLSHSQYAGVAPVSLESYVKQVRRQSVRDVEVHPHHVERAFSHLVLEDRTLSQLGVALNSGTSIFLYGPTGVGKTVIAETMSRVVAEDKVWIPYAVEVDSQIIAVFDPVVHKPAADPLPCDSDGPFGHLFGYLFIG